MIWQIYAHNVFRYEPLTYQKPGREQDQLAQMLHVTGTCLPTFGLNV